MGGLKKKLKKAKKKAKKAMKKTKKEIKRAPKNIANAPKKITSAPNKAMKKAKKKAKGKSGCPPDNLEGMINDRMDPPPVAVLSYERGNPQPLRPR